MSLHMSGVQSLQNKMLNAPINLALFCARTLDTIQPFGPYILLLKSLARPSFLTIALLGGSCAPMGTGGVLWGGGINRGHVQEGERGYHPPPTNTHRSTHLSTSPQKPLQC
jgi:hypothetical protein